MFSRTSFAANFLRFGVEIGVTLAVALPFYALNYQKHLVDQLFQRDTNVAPSGPILSAIDALSTTLQKSEQHREAFLITLSSGDLDAYNQQNALIGQHLTALNRLIKADRELGPLGVQLHKNVHQHYRTANAHLMERQRELQGKPDPSRRAPASLRQGRSTIETLLSDMRTLEAERLRRFRLPWTWAAVLALSALFIVAGRWFHFFELSEARGEARGLQRRSILLDGILNSMTEALVVTDQEGRFTHYNAAAQRIIGSKIKEVSHEADARELGFRRIEDGDPYSLEDLPFRRAIRGDEVEDQEIQIKNKIHPEGTYISLSSRALNDIDGSIAGSLVVFKDISRRKEIEREWMRAREAAIEASRRKSDFLAAMSHEIRTPMNGVIGMTTLLRETPLNAEQKDYVGIIQRSAESLVMLINDILDHSKIEAGKIRLHPQPFDVMFLVRDVMEMFRPAANEKNIGLVLEANESLPWYYSGDAGRLRQILVNLIGNAMKFTERGSVTLALSAVTTGSSPTGRLKFEIKDTGPGLLEEERMSLFEKYFQTTAGSKAGGTGLGLSICKQLVTLMKGDIGVDSTPGLGSNFWFNLELPVADPKDVPQTTETSFAPLFRGRILVAEDQPVNQRVAGTYLRKLGLDVEIAPNGQAAVERIKNGEIFDIVFMDCQMPVMNGYDATRALRDLQGEGPRLPVVALTAEGTSGERTTCFSAGMDDFLTKPLELAPLVAILHKWMPPEKKNTVDQSVFQRLQSYAEGNKDLTRLLIEDLEQSAPPLLQAMHEGTAESAWTRIAEAAHALRSSAGNLGATHLADLCEQLEDLESDPAEQDRPARAQALVQLAEVELKRCLEELKHHLNRNGSSRTDEGRNS